MLRILLTAVLFSLVLPGQALVQSSCALHIYSFNIHYIVPNDKNDDWGERKQAVTRVLKDIDADIVAFQEMETFDGGHYSNRNLQLAWIQSSTSGYKNAATGDPEIFSEHATDNLQGRKIYRRRSGLFLFL